MPENSCANCGTLYQGKFCNACGQKRFSRFTASYLWQGIWADLIGVESSLLFTFKSMWISPGPAIRSYLQGETVRYFSPLKYLIFWTAAHLVSLSFNSNLEAGMPVWTMQPGVDNILTRESLAEFRAFLDWFMKQKTDLYFLGIIPFFSIASYVLFRAKKYNVTEIVIFYTYFCGQFAFCSFVVNVLNSITGWNGNIISTLLIFIPYFFLFFRMHIQFFNEGKTMSTVLRTIAVYIAGTTSFWMVVFLTFNGIKMIAT